jgi:hypothetical protein
LNIRLRVITLPWSPTDSERPDLWGYLRLRPLFYASRVLRDVNRQVAALAREAS